jgi:hypothetical protein
MRIKRFEAVEINVPSGSTLTRFYFPDLPNLRNRPITGIEAYSATEQATSNSGQTVQALSDMPNASVTLYYDGGEYIVVPILSLRRVGNNGANTAFYGDIPALAGQNIVWTKSYVSMNATVASFAAKSFVFNVYYKR